jgi:prepilin-type N-terminal cleavage/methylation domain-containing protein
MARRGFTLVELMIVVVIIGVLAVIAGTAYRRYMDAGRTTEVYSVMGEFRAKEEAYRAEASTYVTTTAIDENNYYPSLTTGQEPKPKYWNTNGATPPAGWVTLGINAGRTQLYCGYVVISGAPGNWGISGPVGQQFLTGLAAGGNPPTVPWWYLNASCDNDGNPAVNATFTTAYSTTTVHAANEHR